MCIKVYVRNSLTQPGGGGNARVGRKSTISSSCSDAALQSATARIRAFADHLDSRKRRTDVRHPYLFSTSRDYPSVCDDPDNSDAYTQGVFMYSRSDFALWALCAASAIPSAALAQQHQGSVLVGQWHAQFQTSQGGGDIYIEYSKDGHFRGVIYTPSQPMTVAQSFGSYTATLESADRVHVHRTISRRLPSMLCEPSGANCRPVPSGPAEIDGSLIDSSNMALRRESIPQQFLEAIPERIFLHQVPFVVSPSVRGTSSASSANPAIPGPAHMTPRIAPGTAIPATIYSKTGFAPSIMDTCTRKSGGVGCARAPDGRSRLRESLLGYQGPLPKL